MNKKMLMIIGAVVVVGGAAAFFLLGGKGEEAAAVVEPEPGLFEMETFLANVSDPTGERFAKLKLKLAIAPSDKIVEIEEDPLLLARLRDRVLTLLTSKSFEELSDPLGKEGFRSEIRMRLNPLVEDGEIKEVLFSEFVVQ